MQSSTQPKAESTETSKICFRSSQNGACFADVVLRIKDRNGEGLGFADGIFITDEQGCLALPSDTTSGMHHIEMRFVCVKGETEVNGKSVYLDTTPGVTTTVYFDQSTAEARCFVDKVSIQADFEGRHVGQIVLMMVDKVPVAGDYVGLGYSLLETDNDGLLIIEPAWPWLSATSRVLVVAAPENLTHKSCDKQFCVAEDKSHILMIALHLQPKSKSYSQ